MSDAPERYADTARNVLLNKTVSDLEVIINQHDPEVDVPVTAGVWDRLDKLALAIEARFDLPLTDAQLLADLRFEALVDAIQDAIDANPTELNLGNYSHDDVCNLQNEAIDVFQILTSALAKLKDTK